MVFMVYKKSDGTFRMADCEEIEEGPLQAGVDVRVRGEEVTEHLKMCHFITFQIGRSEVDGDHV